MKKAAVILAVVAMVVSLASFAFAGDALKGTIKSIDAKAGTVVLTTDSGDKTVTVDKAVDISKLKDGDKVEYSIEQNMVTSLKLAKKPRPKMGC